MTPPPPVRRDLQQLLDLTTAAGTPLDELALLRASLRRYLETGDVAESVAWTAEQLTRIITRYAHHRRPDQE